MPICYSDSYSVFPNILTQISLCTFPFDAQLFSCPTSIISSVLSIETFIQ